jgi:hypothetical protein
VFNKGQILDSAPTCNDNSLNAEEHPEQPPRTHTPDCASFNDARSGLENGVLHIFARHIASIFKFYEVNEQKWYFRDKIGHLILGKLMVGTRWKKMRREKREKGKSNAPGRRFSTIGRLVVGHRGINASVILQGKL